MLHRHIKCTRIFMVAMVLSLSACEKPGQTAYNASELGVSRAVEFGTIIDVKEVKIVGDKNDTNNSDTIPGGAGMWGGGAAGLAAGSTIGNKSGNLLSDVGGALGGALLGGYAEQKILSSTGYQYILTMQNGDTKTIALAKKDGDEVLKPGDKVMMQYCDLEHNKKCKAGEVYQRLIKVDKFPAKPHDAKKQHRHDDGDDDDEKQ